MGVPCTRASLGRRAKAADAGRVRPLYQCRRCQMEQACERQRHSVAGGKVMRLATFTEGCWGPRFGIVRGKHVIDVVAAANVLHQPVPAISAKAALTSGPQTLAALQALVDSAERRGLQRPISGLKFLPPIPDPSKFFCVGKNNK